MIIKDVKTGSIFSLCLPHKYVYLLLEQNHFDQANLPQLGTPNFGVNDLVWLQNQPLALAQYWTTRSQTSFYEDRWWGWICLVQEKFWFQKPLNSGDSCLYLMSHVIQILEPSELQRYCHIFIELHLLQFYIMISSEHIYSWMIIGMQKQVTLVCHKWFLMLRNIYLQWSNELFPSQTQNISKHSNSWTSDVYNMGVILVELVTSLKPVDAHQCDPNLSNSALLFIHHMKEGILDDIIDPRLLEIVEHSVSISPARLWKLRSSILSVASIAYRCLALMGNDRPSMVEVEHSLHEISCKLHAPETEDMDEGIVALRQPCVIDWWCSDNGQQRKYHKL